MKDNMRECDLPSPAGHRSAVTQHNETATTSAGESLLSYVRRLIHQTRQNHAMEHATIHILSRRRPEKPLMGRSTPFGFYLYGELDTDEVFSAAAEALSRFRATEYSLAVHPRCGTNLVVGSLLSGTAAFVVLSRRRLPLLEKVPLLFLATNLALMIAQPLGRLVQEKITTLPAVGNLRINSVSRGTVGKQTSHYVQLTRT